MVSDLLSELIDQQSSGPDRLESHVYKQLLDKIRFGTYSLGEKLPSENDLCEEHGVSRPVVRAALAKLRDSGLIVSRRGAGSFVTRGSPTEQSGFSSLSSIDDITCYFHFRRTIEGDCAEMAARRASPSGIRRLREMVDEVQRRLDNDGESVEADFKFHICLAELSDSRFLLETIDMLRPHWIFVGSFVRSLGMTRVRTGKRMTSEHQAIVEAIAANDPLAARKAMIKHVDGSERRVFKGQ
ncbi:FadR family transcriptional regulator [Paracoccaceae bacterium]|nr:FadR family transcriptional regulator [Paracoccaceae bacterium]